MNSLKHLTITVIFFLCLITILDIKPIGVNGINVQLPARYEIIATLEEPKEISQGSSYFQLNLTTEYEIKLCIIVTPDVKILSLPEGVISHTIKHTPADVWVKDNLGNTFLPIINNTTVSTPEINELLIPSPCEYEITLHFRSIDESRFHQEIGQFAWLYKGSQTALPLSIEYRLPKDYTILQCSANVVEIEKDNFTILHWNLAQFDDVNVYALFMPFDARITINSIKVLVEPSSLKPNGEIQVTFQESLGITGVAIIWNVTTTLEIPISFPIVDNHNLTSILVVNDGQGECKPLRERPLGVTDNSELGHYFADFKNNVILIYPRPSYQGKFQEFDISVTFSIPNEPFGKEGNQRISFWEPYKGFMFTSLNYSVPKNWKLNLTDSFKIIFILPKNTEFASSDGEPYKLGNLNDRDTVEFNYNSPISLPKDNWIVLFDNISSRQFYFYQVYTNMLLLGSVIVILLILKSNKFAKKMSTTIIIELLAPTTILIGLVIKNIGEFLISGYSNWFVGILLVIEVLLCVMFVRYMVIFYKKQKTYR